MRFGPGLAVLSFVVAASGSAWAQFPFDTGERHGKRAQGAIVIRDDAPVYAGESGDEVRRRFSRGDCVAGLHRELIVFSYEFVEEHGRVRVIYPVKGAAKPEDGWMDPDDLVTFTYDCGCEAECMPWSGSLKQARWNPCFQEARDTRMMMLKVIWAQQDGSRKD